jgi:hypothetical protein
MVLDKVESSISATPEEPLASRLLADALADSAEFLTIIQSYTPDTRRNSNNPSTNGRRGSGSGSSTPSPARPGMVATLHLLVVYLQLVAIYDRLLHLLSDQLFHEQDNTTSHAAELPTTTNGTKHDHNQDKTTTTVLPALAQLVSFPFPLSTGPLSSHHHRRGSTTAGGGLQTKILMHAILHQFETIERLLGLPAEFRVTVTDLVLGGGSSGGGSNSNMNGVGVGAPGGLLEDACASGLLDAIMCHEGWYDKEIGGEDDRFGVTVVGPGALASLRGRLRSLRVSLNM